MAQRDRQRLVQVPHRGRHRPVTSGCKHRRRRLLFEQLESRQLLDSSLPSAFGNLLPALGQAGEGQGVLSAGQVDAHEEPAAGEIRGVVWHDTNGNGIRDDGELPLAEWTVYLDLNVDGQWNDGEPWTLTATDGSYGFEGLPPGVYAVAEVIPGAWQQTDPVRAPVETRAVSAASSGFIVNSTSDYPAISADGRFVVFEASGSNPLASPGRNIVLYDRLNNTHQGIDVGLGGVTPNSNSSRPAISADGRFVAFLSTASNLVPSDTNNVADVFVYDRQEGLMERVSVASDGAQANGVSYNGLDISADGRFVAFRSEASNLVAGDTNNTGDIFVRDRLNGTTERVSVGAGGTQANGDSLAPSISGDGLYVAFESDASNLVSGDTNGKRDIFVRDRQLSTTRRVSLTAGGFQASSSSQGAAISGDGRYVGFWSNAVLVTGDTNSMPDVYVYDLQTNQVERISLASDGAPPNESSNGKPSLSADGRYVAYRSRASNLVPGDTNHVTDVFVYDRQTGRVRMASLAATGEPSNGTSNFFALSGDGQSLAFGSDGNNLVSGDTNGNRDVFVTSLSGVYRPAAHIVTLPVDHGVAGVDFGNWQPRGTIQGMKWKDRDRDGVRDSNEAALADWPIYLDANGNGTLDPEETATLTAADGSYVFSLLDAGTYTVAEVLPDDWDQFAPAAGSYTVAVGLAEQVTLDFEDLAHAGDLEYASAYEKDGFLLSTDSQNNAKWNVYGPLNTTYYTGSAALKSTLSITTQWLTRPDGLPFTVHSLDLSSKGVSGSQTITFYGTRADRLPVSQTLSIQHDELQTYALTGFTDLVSLEWRYTNSGSHHQFDNVVLSVTRWDESGLDFGNMIHTGELRGVTWHDLDRDGQRQAGEPLLSGWTVFLDANDNGQWDAGELSTTTDAVGSYAFLDVEPGTYRVAVVLPLGWAQTTPIGAHPLELAPGQVATGIDFGNYSLPATVRGVKWNDLNGDGNRDAGEPPLAGWTIYLDANQNGQRDDGEVWTTTDAEGQYVFDDLVDGLYTVAESPEGGWVQTWPGPAAGGPERVSLQPNGSQGAGRYTAAAISGDGRYVAFAAAWNLTNGNRELYVRDRQAGTTTKLSLSTTGGQADGNTGSISISADGRYVAFSSTATNLVANDTNRFEDVFVHDRVAGTTTRVSVASDGTQAGGSSTRPSISADGRYVAFVSAANNLVAGDTGWSDIFVHDRQTATTARVSLGAGGTAANGHSGWPAISGDGRFVAFHSWASNLVAGDTNGLGDIFVYDRQAGTAQRIVADAATNQPPQLALSADGRHVAFVSPADGLVPEDANGQADVFVYDRLAGQLERLAVASWTNNSDAGSPSISGDGRFVAFASGASDLVRGDTNGQVDIFVFDRQRNRLQRLSVPLDGQEPNGSSSLARISEDGRHVAFESLSSNLVAGDTNLAADVFVQANPPAVLPGTYWLQLHPGETAEHVDFGNRSEIPIVVGIQPSGANPSAAALVHFSVSFSVPVSGVDASDFALATTGVAGAAIIDVTGSGRDYVVGVYTGSGNGTVRLDLIDDDSITGAAGQRLGGSGAGNGSFVGGVYEIDKPPPGEIRGRKWHDLDGDGTQDAGEPALAGWTIFLDLNGDGQWTSGEPSAVTDADGDYVLQNLAPGSYSVRAVPQPGWELTSPLSQLQIERVAPTESVASNTGNLAAISGDGRYVTFRSTANHLVPNDTNARADIFVLDRLDDTIQRVSVHSSGAEANGDSFDPSISGDGRFVAFRSAASNLVDGDTNNQHDIFVHDRQTGQTRRVSVDANGSQANGYNSEPILSADGAYVVFYSGANNLVPGDTNGVYDTFIVHLETGAIERASVRSDGGQSNTNSWGGIPSADGSQVVFESTAANLVGGDTNGATDVFLRDRAAGTTQRISLAADGSQANGGTRKRWISGDGRYVVLESLATNLVPGDTNGQRDIFLLDLLTGDLERISVAEDGTQSNGESSFPQISGDGRFVVFESTATNLVAASSGGVRNVYRYDRLTGGLQRVSAALLGAAPNGNSERPYISHDGRSIVFHSGASNLVPDDTNGANDVFVAELNQYTTSARHRVRLASAQVVVGQDFASRDAVPPTVQLEAPPLVSTPTPRLTVTATDNDRLPDGTPVWIDVDLNGDGDFSDPGEAGYGMSSLTAGAAEFDLEPALPEGVYALRARLDDPAGNEGLSPPVEITIDLTPPEVVQPVADVTVAEDAASTVVGLASVFADTGQAGNDALTYSVTISLPIDSLVAQVSQSSYTTLHQDLLYTHTGDNRGLGGWEHDLARDNIYSYFVQLGLETSLEPFLYQSQTYYNVVGIHPGVTRPDDVYLVGAHYDSVNNPGADDNASGVAAVMELARVLTQYQFDASLVFVAFDREEQGLHGSKAYANAHAGDSILGMLSLDMIAYNIPGTGHDTVRFYDWNGVGRIKSDLAAAFAVHSGGLATLDSGAEYGSDHYWFEQMGFDAALVIEYAVRDNPHYHRAADAVETPGYIDYVYATKITRGVLGYLATAAGLASSSDLLTATLSGQDLILDYAADAHGIVDVRVRATDAAGLFAENTFRVTVTPVNDAPVLDNTGAMALAAIDEDDISNAGTLVRDLLASAGGQRITDVDQGALAGLAVTAVDNTHGSWQYTINHGRTWLPFGTPGAASARLLGADAGSRIRFLPHADWHGTVDPGLTFRVWDHTVGINGGTADASVGGDATAFSAAVGTASLVVNSVWDTFIVTAFQPTATGFVAEFSSDLDTSVLNLYDQGGIFGPADVTVVGDVRGTIRGSLVVDPGLRRLTFVKTAGLLEPDTYTVTLYSGTTALRDAAGRVLDGDEDEVAGGDYVTTFVVPAAPAAAVIVSLPNVTRGYGQSVNIPADDLTAGLPLTLSDGAGLSGLDFELHYDKALLEITGFVLDSGVVARDGVSQLTFPSAGVARLTVDTTGSLGAAAGSLILGAFTARVPDDAIYGGKHVLDISSLRVYDNGPLLQQVPSIDDDAIHVAAFLGDTSGDGWYNSPDATLTRRIIGQINTGFGAYPLADPVLIADITGNGLIQSNDTTAIRRAIGQIAVPQIPPLPQGLALPAAAGPDPRVFIPRDLAGAPGETVTVPVMIEVTEPAGVTIGGLDLLIEFDPARFTVSQARLGGLLQGTDLAGSLTQPSPGKLIYTADSLVGTPHLPLGTQGELLRLTVAIAADAAPGPARWNLLASLGAGRTGIFDGSLQELVLSPPPTNAADDAVDGLLIVNDGSPPWHNPANGRDVNDDGQVTALDALIVINRLNAEAAGDTSPPVRYYYDVNNDSLCTPLDVLIVINQLNAEASSAPAGERAASVPPPFAEQAVDMGNAASGGDKVWLFERAESDLLPLDAVLGDLADDIASAWQRDGDLNA